MRRSVPGILLGLLIGGLPIPGCGGDPFGPPSTPKRGAGAGSRESETKSIYFVVPGVPEGDVLAWAANAQTEANLRQVVFRVMVAPPGDRTTGQAELVKRALADGASALLVVAGDDPALPKALADAESGGVPVVLIGRSLAAPEGSKPFTTVELGEFEESARKIVGATVDDLKKSKRTVEGTAIVLVNSVADATLARRVEAMKAAASKAGFPKVIPLTIDGSKLEAAKGLLKEAVKANPDVAIFLATDNETLFVAEEVRIALKGSPLVFAGGFTNYTTTIVLVFFMRESAFVEGRFEEMARLGVVTILKKLQGEEVGPVVLQSPKFNRGLGTVSSPEAAKNGFPGPQEAGIRENAPNEANPGKP